MSDLLFSAEGVGKRFGEKAVLKSASFWVRTGRITALLGRNGCGKTTLLKCGLGELRMDQGTVRVQGEVMLRPRLWRLAMRGVWFVDQNARLPPMRTLRALVSITSRKAGKDPTPWVDRLRLEPLLDSNISSLSRGERKRAALVLALVSGATCLVLDEPMEGIDPQDKDVIAGCLRSLADAKIGVILTGHDARSLLDTASHVIWCVAGTTHDLGAVAEAREHSQFVREYLGPGFDELSNVHKRQ